MRKIDADAIKYTVVSVPMGNGVYKDANVVYETDIDAMPTIEQLTCHDCIHFDREDWICFLHNMTRVPSWFCADGEKVDG